MLRVAVCVVVVSGCAGAATVAENRDTPTNRADASGAVEAARSKKLSLTASATSLERLTEDPIDEYGPVINRDGSSLLFQVEAYEDTSEGRKLKEQTIVGVNPKKLGARTLFTTAGRFSHDPAWSPDGASYLYVTNAMGPLAMVRALTASPNAPLAVIAASDVAPDPEGPTASADGARIAFSMQSEGGGRAVATIGPDGSKLIVIGEGRSPAWSPDGKRLAFVRTAEEYNQIFSGEPGSPALVQVTKGSADCDHPTWSPDGTWLAFASNRGFEALGKKRSGALHVFAIKVDGSGLVQLTQGESLAGEPSWGADGWIYFSSNRDGNFDVFRLKPALQ